MPIPDKIWAVKTEGGRGWLASSVFSETPPFILDEREFEVKEFVSEQKYLELEAERDRLQLLLNQATQGVSVGPIKELNGKLGLAHQVLIVFCSEDQAPDLVKYVLDKQQKAEEGQT